LGLQKPSTISTISVLVLGKAWVFQRKKRRDLGDSEPIVTG
jgi:hypothetical protein